MRTTLDIPEEILEEARRVCGHRTKRETVISGLEELIKKAKREELRRLAGKMNLRIDLARSRRRRTA
ncbi:MAG TPA: type II toxin-antitoxin system VapB family antitoxin [Thermoanaerobaculia bacterium]|jgi:Arc/MetJ family transcription regulator|nr:type II toxin-antitoxin system VapB family antitoxin [Thermoanaerobaculia bacterium]HSP94595.1 type II toxin-antitoxin system VapB family antitoxin [Thermoanaerobaculia bacterium]